MNACLGLNFVEVKGQASIHFVYNFIIITYPKKERNDINSIHFRPGEFAIIRVSTKINRHEPNSHLVEELT